MGMVVDLALELGDILRTLEAEDTVIFEEVDLKKYISTVGAPPARRTPFSGSDPQARRSNSASTSDKISKEKSALMARKQQLLTENAKQKETIRQLKKKKEMLEKQLNDQIAKGRAGVKTPVEEPGPRSDTPDDEKNWKQMFLDAESEYKQFWNELTVKGLTRVSRARLIPPPSAADDV